MLGYFTFILHTHLPYVLHHGKWPHGSDWLSEAAAECYIPLLEMLERLTQSGNRTRISIDFSPINLEQLTDPAFIDVFTAYCDEKIEAAEKDHAYFETNGETHFQPLAEYWREFYSTSKEIFLSKYQGNLVSGFKKFSDLGVLDAMTCGATHGYFPLLLTDANIRAQINLAIDTHEKHFGKRPRGIWLPECGYRPSYKWHPPVGPEEYKKREYDRLGVEELVSEAGLEYFVVDGSLTKGSLTTSVYHWFAKEIRDLHNEIGDLFDEEPRQPDPTRWLSEIYGVKSTERELKGKIPAIFSRDAQTASIVWSGEMGYPGSPPYLDFHKKHHNSGLRYWRVTGGKVDLADKLPYDPALIDPMIESNASHFVSILENTLVQHYAEYAKPGIVASPFDTELFGHWWFEGPKFIERVITLLDRNTDIRVTNCAEALDTLGFEKVIALPEGSWGEGGHHFVWLNKEVKWMWEVIYPLEDQFLQSLNATPQAEIDQDDLLKTLFTQAARELLLLEASDWEFVISTKGAIDYSIKRFNEHADRLTALLSMIERYKKDGTLTEEDTEVLETAIMEDRPFEDINLNYWRLNS